MTIAEVSEDFSASILRVDDMLSKQERWFLEEFDAVKNLKELSDQLSNCYFVDTLLFDFMFHFTTLYSVHVRIISDS